MSLVISAAPPIVTAWTSYSPTCSWTTNVAPSGFWRRVGENIELALKLSFSGAPGGANTVDPKISLPNSLTLNTAVMVFTTGGTTLCFLPGNAASTLAGTTYYNHVPYAVSSDAGNIYLGGTQLTTTYTGTQYIADTAFTTAAPFVFANGASIVVTASAPISGWGVTV